MPKSRWAARPGPRHDGPSIPPVERLSNREPADLAEASAWPNRACSLLSDGAVPILWADALPGVRQDGERPPGADLRIPLSEL